MAALDWFFLIILAVSMLMGAWRGLVFETLLVAGWVMAFFVAQWYAADVGAALPMDNASESLRYAAGFVAVFIGVVFVCGLIASLGKKWVQVVGLRPVDRTLGAMFGAARAAVLILAMGVVVAVTPLHRASWWVDSQGADVVANVFSSLKPLLPLGLRSHLPSSL